MKLFSAFAGLAAANNMLPMMMLLDDDSNSVCNLGNFRLSRNNRI